MRREGASAEEVARKVHAQRRRLAAFFKQRTPEPLRSQIYSRTLSVYSDPIGPTIETPAGTGQEGGDDIIDSATRPGPLPSFGAAG